MASCARTLGYLLPGWLALACATVAGPAEVAGSRSAVPGCEPERDRAAIRGMAGEYGVSFSFQEHLALTEGYKPRDRYEVDGTELVLLIEDTPARIALQHLLVTGPASEPRVIKHWRQDWTFQDRELLEYRSGGTWHRRILPVEQVRCTWSQAVFEVNDAPRYEGWGPWRHADGTSSWTSNETWRPLPRREYSQRDDYDVVIGFNRHVMTPTGWAHEQDNTKVVMRGAPRALVREHGVNVYNRTRSRDFTPARDYWSRTQAFWQEVRGAWRDFIASAPRLSLRPDIDPNSQHENIFSLASDPAVTGAVDTRARRVRIDQAIRENWQSGPAVTARR